MKNIPIVTVKDLATDSFIAAKTGIDLKLSREPGNGLKLTPDGLEYSASAGVSRFPRRLLGAFTPGAIQSFDFDGEIEITIGVQNLGSDGNYIYYSLRSPHELMVRTHNHQDDETYSNGNVDYGQVFANTYWGNSNVQKTISYVVNGVSKAIVLSYVQMAGIFYVWCDLLSTAVSGSGDEDSGSVENGSILYTGKEYDRLYLDATYNLRFAILGGYDRVLSRYDYYLVPISPNGLIEPMFSFLGKDNRTPARVQYHYASGILAIVHQNGSQLKVIDRNLNVTDFSTGREDENISLEIYPDPNSDNIMIAVGYGNNDVVDVYSFDDEMDRITKTNSYGVNFNLYQQGSSYYHIMALKVVSETRIAIALFLAMNDGQDFINKALLVDTITGEVVEDRFLNDASIYTGVQDQNWFMDIDSSNGDVTIYEATETGFNSILQHSIGKGAYPTLFKAPNFDSVAAHEGLPGLAFNDWEDDDLTIITPYLDGGAPTLYVQKAKMSATFNDGIFDLGIGELSVGDFAFVATIDSKFQTITVDVTIVPDAVQ